MVKKEFNYEGIKVVYSLYKEDRKSLSISVAPNMQVIVKSPLKTTCQGIELFLKKKIIWIEKQKDYFKQFRQEKKKEFISGESFLYLGRRYKLLVKKAGLRQYVALENGIITVYSHLNKDSKRTEELLNTWFDQKRISVFNLCLKNVLKNFDYKQDFKIVIRKMNKRWGSFLFNRNIIVLNQDLIKASKKAIKYVITHELCHFKHRNHDKLFYKLLESKISDWKKIKEELEIKLGSK